MSFFLKAIRGLDRFNTFTHKFLAGISGVIMAIMLGVVVLGVISRMTGLIVPWTEKILLILLPLLTFAIAPVSYKYGLNVGLDLLINALPNKLKHIHGIALHGFVLLILLIALDLTLRKVGQNPIWLSSGIEAITGIDLTQIRPFKAPIKIPIIKIEWKYVYMSMPVGVGLMLVVALEMIARHLYGLFAKSEDLPHIRTGLLHNE